MSDPRYRPRDFTSEPRAFGHAKGIRWRHANTDREHDLVEASRMQHYYALLIRNALEQSDMSIAAYAIEAGDTHDRISRILRGTAIMRFEDVARAQRILGHIVQPEIEKFDRHQSH